MSLIWKGDFAGLPGKVVLANPMVCTNTAKGDNKLYSDAKGVVPSLDLRFASQKNLNDYMTGQNLITFSRPVGANQSPGTYVDQNGLIQLSSANTPRFDHDPTTGESLGFLIEESRTNLLAYSQAIGPGNDSFATDASTVTQNAAVSPDGTTTATSISGDMTYAQVAKTGLTVGVKYTFSFYVKTVTQTFLQFGVVGVVGDIVSVTPNEWNRVSITFTTVAQFANLRFYSSSPSGETLLVWGAQLELGSFPTSYIPTTGTALTRSADNATITGSNFSSWYNQSEGSIYAESNAYNLSSLSALFSANDGSFSNRITSTPLTYGLFIATNNVIQVSINAGGAWNSGQVVKAGFGIAANDFSVVLDGSTLNTDNSGSIPVVNRLNIGRNAGNTSPWNGTISRLTYFPDRLPDATLQAITAP